MIDYRKTDGWAEEHNDEVGVTIRHISEDGYSLNVVVKEGTRQRDGSIYYTYCPQSASEPTDDFDTGDILFCGFVKWDGCSHFEFGGERGEDEDVGYLHLCGEYGFRHLQWALNRVKEIAKTVPNFDNTVARFRP